MILPFKPEKITIRIVGLSVITFKFKIGEQSGPSKLKRYMSAMRTIRSYAVAAIADAEILRKYGTELATRQISPNRPFKRRTPAGF